MRIAFAGLPSTGKTTLINRLKENPEFSDYFVPPSVGRTLKAMGIPINEHGTLKTQIGALSLHLRVIDQYKDIFHERSLIDPVAFSIAEGKFTKEENGVLLEILGFNLKDKPCYDKIIYLPRHIAYVPDGVRTQDEVFLMKLELAFHDVYSQLSLPDNVFHIVTSFGIEERYQEVLDFIKS
jgi:hypothetical protein